jgi:YD repeat-containing protein
VDYYRRIICPEYLFGAEPHQAEDFRNKIPTEVIEENISCYTGSKEVNKNKKRLNSNNRVLWEERYGPDGKVSARLTYTYDTSGVHSLSRKFEQWQKFGYTSETAYYEYDNQMNLIKITDKNQTGAPFQETRLTNNEKGHPVRLHLTDGNGNTYGFETATYDYALNKAYTVVQDSRGKILSRDTLTIDLRIRRTDETYNEVGDVVQTPDHFYQYEYDQFGNWITMTVFELVKGKKKKDRVYKRKLKYD